MRGREVGGREAGPDLSTATDLQPSTFNRQKASQMKVLPSYLCLNQLNHCLDTRNKLSQRRLTSSIHTVYSIYTYFIHNTVFILTVNTLHIFMSSSILRLTFTFWSPMLNRGTFLLAGRVATQNEKI